MMEKNSLTTFKHKDMCFTYVNTEKGLWLKTLNPGKGNNVITEAVPFPNFQIGVAGIPYGFCPALTQGYTAISSEMKMKKVEDLKDSIFFTYMHEKTGLVVEVNMQLILDANVIRQTTTVRNEGQSPVVLNHLSSMCMNGIASDGIIPWNHSKKIRVHYCMQTWNGEGQWRNAGIEDLGLYPTSTHPSAGSIHFSSIGSWSTGRYLPMAVIEDMETNKVWYFQIETSASWHFEIGHRGSWENSDGALFIHADGADERFGGWVKKLLPGESFTSVPVAVGCCMGNFNDAIKELTLYRRGALKPEKACERECPVVFNDYMNCLWGNPTREKLIPIINAAFEAGSEGFCIDAGWFGDLTASWNLGLGDWNPSANRFGKAGLEGVLDYIKSKGMIPGVWLEMEVCGENSEVGKKPDSWFLMRHEIRVGGGERWFLKFTNPAVREYMHGVIDRLVSMGVGFIKNDYNLCIGNGDDSLGSSAVDGLIVHMRAFYSFIDEVRAKHIRLIIENCGSGGMREDYGILSHFHIQSSSDQEIYHNYPSILGGGLAAVLPEQLGIWVYPYPLLFSDIKNPDILKTKAYQDLMKDGEQTIFNMVNGMCGNMYLSGHLEAADELNMGLIKEGIALYKKERKHIHNSYPFWPTGFTKINDKNSWGCVALANEENTRILLAVWRIGCAEEYMELPIYKWDGRIARVRQIYPQKGYEVDTYYNNLKGALTVHLPKTFTARYFEVLEVL